MMAWIQGRRLARAIMAERFGMAFLGAGIVTLATSMWPGSLGLEVVSASRAQSVGVFAVTIGSILVIVGQVLGANAIQRYSDYFAEEEAAE